MGKVPVGAMFLGLGAMSSAIFWKMFTKLAVGCERLKCGFVIDVDFDDFVIVEDRQHDWHFVWTHSL